MKISCVIPHYHKDHKSEWLLRRALAALKRTEPEVLKRTVVIDDGSPNRAVEEALPRLSREFGCSYLLRLENLGFSTTVNQGIEFCKSSSDAVLLLNNDVEMQVPFSSHVAQVFAAMPRTAIVGALLLYPIGTVQAAGFDIIPEGAPIEHYKHQMYCLEPDGPNKPRFVMGVTAACQFIRTKAIDEIGLYPDDYRLGYEDVHYCLNAWKNGWHVFYAPQVFGVHHESASRGYFLGERELDSVKTWGRHVGDFDIPRISSRVELFNEFISRAADQRDQDQGSI